MLSLSNISSLTHFITTFMFVQGLESPDLITYLVWSVFINVESFPEVKYKGSTEMVVRILPNKLFVVVFLMMEVGLFLCLFAWEGDSQEWPPQKPIFSCSTVVEICKGGWLFTGRQWTLFLNRRQWLPTRWSFWEGAFWVPDLVVRVWSWGKQKKEGGPDQAIVREDREKENYDLQWNEQHLTN